MEWGSVSDWFSTACNAVMAGVAVYAAKNAKDWLSPKLNDRKFKFADELIDSFCKLQQEAFYLHNTALQIINTEPDDQGDTALSHKEYNIVFDKQMTYRKSVLSLKIEMERMDLWGLKARNKDDFDKLVDSHFQLSYVIEESLIPRFNDNNDFLQSSYENSMKISEKYRNVRALHNNIIKHYNQLFVD